MVGKGKSFSKLFLVFSSTNYNCRKVHDDSFIAPSLISIESTVGKLSIEIFFGPNFLPSPFLKSFYCLDKRAINLVEVVEAPDCWS